MASTDRVGAWQFSLHGGTKTPEMAQFKSNFIVMHYGAGKNGTKHSVRSLQVQPAAHQLICGCKISKSFSTTFSLKVVIFVIKEMDRAYHNNLL